MADRIVKILAPAPTYDLMTLEELKLATGIEPADTSTDAQLAQLITRFSDVVATTCNRVFAYEQVRETWRCLQSNRVFLSHFPIKEADVLTVECPRGTVLSAGTDYEIEEHSGKIELITTQSEPIVVTYFGGYDVPQDTPPAVKQAVELLIREERALAARLETSGVRSITHKEARIMFFDPLTLLTKTQGFGWATTTANALLMHYTRFEC